jgi:hypothetical protein
LYFCVRADFAASPSPVHDDLLDIAAFGAFTDAIELVLRAFRREIAKEVYLADFTEFESTSSRIATQSRSIYYQTVGSLWGSAGIASFSLAGSSLKRAGETQEVV